MKMLAPDIEPPWPRPSHEVPLGATIWKKIGPEPELAVDSGMLTVYWTPFSGAELAKFWALVPAAAIKLALGQILDDI